MLARRSFVLPPLALLVACSAAPAPPSSASRPIIGGQRDSGHPATVALVVQWDGLHSFCSGTLVTPRHVVTAAHCIEESGIPPALMRAFFGTEVAAEDGPVVPVRRVHVHSGYNRRAILNDIALLELSADAPVAPAALPARRLGSADIGRELVLVGFGVDNARRQSGGGIKRTVNVRLRQLGGTQLRYGERDRGACQGDSGGPAFLVEEGVETLYGVTSYGTEDCVSSGADTRVDAYGDWLRPLLPADDAGPELTVTAPAAGDTVEPSFMVSATASDPSGVVQVSVWADGAFVTAGLAPPYEIPVALRPGRHALVVRAIDPFRNRTEVPLEVNILCFEDAECGDGRVCGEGACVERPPVGTACGADDECPEGRCVAGGDGQPVCSRGCASATDCPAGWECGDGACVRQLGLAPGVVGAPCVADGQCATGRCASAESPIGFCTAECGEGAGCPHGAACGGDGLCGPPVAATSGCAVGGPAAPPAGLLALALLALLRRRRIIA